MGKLLGESQGSRGKGAGYLEGWYSSSVVLPDPGTDVIWLAPDGRESAGVYDIHGRWLAPCGRWVMYVPLRWRQPDGPTAAPIQVAPTPEHVPPSVEQPNRLWPRNSSESSRRKHWVVAVLNYDRTGLQN
ncbi:MAG TPA: hypothetical protein DD670_20475 [Planctomycetaceae bacterium]|nr:hypothetical protein [Planctomycetaceae bacterium]